MGTKKIIKYIDLFAGLGGTRIGLQQALEDNGFNGECVFTSEIKPHAVSTYSSNFPGDSVSGDITQIDAKDIPDFDILLAGFPCQPFSSAGVRKGFMDTRGTLFFDIERILKEKKPAGFLLENVEGLVTHDRVDRTRPIGRTLETILKHLDDLGYNVSWRVLDASKYGVPQKRKRIYITGSLKNSVDLQDLKETPSKLASVLEKNLPEDAYMKSDLASKLLSHYSLDQLRGKQVKDKRGGNGNIHSWDVGLKGEINEEQKYLLEELLKQRRRKSWAIKKGIPWADGMPLTLDEIATFHTQTLFEHTMTEKQYLKYLKTLLDDLVNKGYLKFEKPKKTTPEYQLEGYNIIAGKLSFEISNILDPELQTPTLVATDVTRMAVADNKGLRRLTVREGLRLFGFPEEYTINGISYAKTFDLLGNSVSVNAIQLVCDRLIKAAF